MRNNRKHSVTEKAADNVVKSAESFEVQNNNSETPLMVSPQHNSAITPVIKLQKDQIQFAEHTSDLVSIGECEDNSFDTRFNQSFIVGTEAE